MKHFFYFTPGWVEEFPSAGKSIAAAHEYAETQFRNLHGGDADEDNVDQMEELWRLFLGDLSSFAEISGIVAADDWGTDYGEETAAQYKEDTRLLAHYEAAFERASASRSDSTPDLPR
jgi:hypothetical protein